MSQKAGTMEKSTQDAKEQEAINALKSLRAKILKTESGKSGADPKDTKGQALLVVSNRPGIPEGPKDLNGPDFKDFYEHLAASLSIPSSGLKKKNSPKLGSCRKLEDKKPSESVSSSTAVQSDNSAALTVNASSQASSAETKLNKEEDLDELGVELQTTEKKKTDISADITADKSLASVSSADGKTAVIVTAEEGEEDSETEKKVCVVDLKNAEWWTLVEKEEEGDENLYVDCKPDGTSVDVNPDEEAALETEDDFGEAAEPLGEPFEIIKDDELATAISEYVAQSMKNYPEAKQVPPEELKKILDKAFAELKPKGVVSKVWGWGQFAYTTYGWGQWCLKMYKEPQLVKLIATGVWNAAQFALIFVL
jgi:hypothetical protein